MQDYHFINQSGIYEIPNVDDGEDFFTTLRCMQNVGFNEEEIDQIIDVLVGILNLGNIEFDEVHKKGVGPCSQLSAKSLQFAKSFG